ncbi:aldehyde dehydrogenase family protein [Kibdelosporangium aridum]|uniref:aldehyde dehydrogenase family protein n=1 Tax=Kibdelosporangium aridum TaxID=2030 RepID=UPI0035E9EBFA
MPEVGAVTEFLRHMLADKLQDRHLLIGVAAASTGSVHESIDPSTGEVVGAYVSGGRAEAQAAIAAARSTFDTTGWSRDPSLRSRALNELADRLAERVAAIAHRSDRAHSFAASGRPPQGFASVSTWSSHCAQEVSRRSR